MKVITIVLAGALAWFPISVQSFGLLTPTEAYDLTVAYDNVYIVDVRTDAEWIWVGHPGPNKLGYGEGLEGKVLNVSYMIFKKKSFIVNPSFISDMDDIFEDNENVTLIMMCRSGGRGAAAAAALEAAGYTDVYNMATGFEGGSDANGYRTINGWKVDGLPYKGSSPKDPNPDWYQD